jgi:NAD+ kinase
MELKTVVVVANLDKRRAAEYLKSITKTLETRGITPLVLSYRGQEAVIPELEMEYASAQAAIVLGGDGTVLFSCRLFASHPIPILGVNLGTVGFMTEVLGEEWLEALESFQRGEAGISERLMLDIEVHREGRVLLKEAGLNDCVLSGSSASRLVVLDVDLSGVFLGSYRADGLIIASPTGSTAYSLSAGGPILHPETEALILTPICPHSLSNRPLVLPAQEKITVTVKQNQRIPVTLTVDGRGVFQPRPGDKITVSRHPKKALLVKSDRRSFYEIVHAKLN